MDRLQRSLDGFLISNHLPSIPLPGSTRSEIYRQITETALDVSYTDVAQAVRMKERSIEIVGGVLEGQRTRSGRLIAVSEAGDLLFLPKKRGELYGEGSFKRVYKVFVIRPDGSVEIWADATVRKNADEALEEDKFAGQIPSEHVVKSAFRVKYAGSQGKTLSRQKKVSLIQPRATEGSLHDFARRYGLTVGQQIGLMKQMAEGIKALHDQGLLHCDIKPKNVLIFRTPEGKVEAKLADFGLSINEKDAAKRGAKGTPAFWLRSANENSRETDIYALGVTFDEFLKASSLTQENDLMVRQALYELIDIMMHGDLNSQRRLDIDEVIQKLEFIYTYVSQS